MEHNAAEIGRRDAESAEKSWGRREPSEELDRLTETIIGAAIEVHRHLGPGFLESIYERALLAELQLRDLQVRAQVTVPVSYKQLLVGEHRIDLLVEEQVVIELKAIESIASVHMAQLRSLLRASGLQVGLLINFNVAVLSQGVRRAISNP